MLTTVYKEQEI